MRTGYFLSFTVYLKAQQPTFTAMALTEDRTGPTGTQNPTYLSLKQWQCKCTVTWLEGDGSCLREGTEILSVSRT